MKRCRKCRLDKPLDAFPPHKATRDGRSSPCRACRAEYERVRYAENPVPKWRKGVDTSKKWREKNPERWREVQRVQNWRRREARNAMKSDVDVREFTAILRSDPCAYCGGPCEHIDHIEAHAAGCPTTWENLTASCGHCNRVKWKTPLLAFLLTRTTDLHRDTR